MLERAANGTVCEGDWLIAETQTAGRGRRGRAWSSPAGNLYASRLVTIVAGDPLPPTLALVAGIAVIEALGSIGMKLKWPNDLVDVQTSAKLAGIMLERQGSHIVVGVGVNLIHHPDLPDRRTTSLLALGFDLSVKEAMTALVEAFARWFDIWRNQGLDPVRAAWLQWAHAVGTPLRAELPDGHRVEGTFDGLTDDCALRLRLPDGSTRVIHAGDVFLV